MFDAISLKIAQKGSTIYQGYYGDAFAFTSQRCAELERSLHELAREAEITVDGSYDEKGELLELHKGGKVQMQISRLADYVLAHLKSSSSTIPVSTLADLKA